ncbi:MAG: dephospho-CoA kinase [Clostridia bacterium]|nr:dephospho-CoA kinase [Clostridia bacterium]
MGVSIKIIGVTGPSGAGKSLFCTRLKKYGIETIDADEVYHSLLVPPSQCLDAIRNAFGDPVFSPDGSLDRSALGAVVFSSPEKLELLNKTVLGFVINKMEEMIASFESEGKKFVFVDAPTLIESGFNKKCHTVISILSPKETRISRIAVRDKITEEKAKERVMAQHSDEFYISHSDIVLENTNDEASFIEKTDGLLLSIGAIKNK